MKLVVIVSIVALTASLAHAADSAKAKNAPAAKAAKPAAKAKAAPAAPTGAALAASFTEFCKEWMGKLAEREARNISMIKWDSGQNWVQGSYTGYSSENTCVVDGEGISAVGKLTYREVLFEKRGTTIADAQNRPPHPIETTEVLEMFRFEKGEWVY